LALALTAATTATATTTTATASTASTASTATTATTTLVWWLLQRVNLALYQVAVVLTIRVIRAKLQRGFISLYGVGPFLYRLLRRRLLGLLSCSVQRVAKVVIRIFLIGQPLRGASRRDLDGLFERLCRLRKLPGAIRGRADVVLEQGRFIAAGRGRRLLFSALGSNRQYKHQQ